MNCIALFVGNNQYEDIGKLRYAEQDATDLRKLFASIGWKCYNHTAETIRIITISAVLLGGTYVLAKLLVWWLF